MPGLDGWAVLAALKADPRPADIPVVMLTIVDDRNLGYALGAADYLTKPIDRERLLEVIGAHRPRAPGARGGRRRRAARAAPPHARARGLRGGGGGQRRRRLSTGCGSATPGVILLDLMMPVMDGFEFLEELRREEAWRGIPVIVLTGRDLSAEDRERLNGSVARILQKGAYGQDALLAEVRALVAASVGRRTAR